MLNRMITLNQNLNPESLHMVTYEGVVIDSICSQGFLFGEFDMGKSRFKRRGLLCACGHCNEYVKWSNQNKKWNKFIHGHCSDKFRQAQSKRLMGNQYRKGCKHTEEFKKNVSKRMLAMGDNHPMRRPEIIAKFMGDNNHMRKEKMREWFRKNNPSKRPEVRKKQSETKIGDLNPAKRPEVRAKISKTLMGKYCGPESGNWKGGISAEPYCDIWLDKNYKQSIRDRDNNECQNPDCWKTSKKLCGHHIDYDKKNCHPWNVITLCNSCNARANINREYWIKFYQTIMNKKYEYKYD